MCAIAKESDVLIIGGGFAGAWAAIRAAELGVRVILVDKAVVSRSGASTLTSGVTTGPTRDDDLEEWVQELVEKGGFTSDERWTRQLLEGHVKRLEQLDAWGVPFIKDADGRIKRYLSRGMVAVRGVQYNPKRAMEILRDRALAAGVAIAERTAVTHLLTSDGCYPTSGEVVGAVGFDVHSGVVTCFQASSVILASGPMALKGHGPVDNCTGDGMAMAVKVGASIIDPEFAYSGTFNIVWGQYRVASLFNIGLGHGLTLRNARGERFMEHYDPGRMERGELQIVVAAFVKEILEGRGPVYMDLRDCDSSFWSNLQTARGRQNAAVLFGDGLPDPRSTPVVIEAPRGFWSNSRTGPKIGLDCSTSVPNLYAAGAVAKNDANGTHGSAGVPTAFAMVSGYIAGEAAAVNALDGSHPHRTLSQGELETWERELKAPLRRVGRVTTSEAVDELLELQGTIIDNFQLTEATLAKRLSATRTMRQRLETLVAGDLHDLVKAHELRNIAIWMELSFAAMLDRTESRMNFLRLDYPYTDDFEWRCWHVARYDGDTFHFSKMRYPYAGARYQPPPPQRYLDPVARVFLGAEAEAVGAPQ